MRFAFFVLLNRQSFLWDITCVQIFMTSSYCNHVVATYLCDFSVHLLRLLPNSIPLAENILKLYATQNYNIHIRQY